MKDLKIKFLLMMEFKFILRKCRHLGRQGSSNEMRLMKKVRKYFY